MTTLDMPHTAPNTLRHYMVGLCAVIATATPLYVHFGTFEWIVGGDYVDQALPANLETAVGWSLWFAQAGAIVGAGIVVAIVGAYCFAATARRARISAAIVSCLAVELVWVAATVLSIAVVVDALLAT